MKPANNPATSPGTAIAADESAINSSRPEDSASAGFSGFASTSSGWSTGFSRLLAVGGQLSSSLKAVQQQVVASPPTLTEGGIRTAAVPRRVPTIPGVADLEPWARGGMGIVYRGRDATLGRPVAVKVMWPSTATSERSRERAKREAQVLARISHPNVVTVHAAGDVEESPYIVMEWIDGASLQQRMAHGLPSPQQAVRIVRDLAMAVAVVHDAGIVHRDIKPDNVLLAGPTADDWERCVPKLADFGLARPTDMSDGITQDAMALGTPAYMAPEQTGLAVHLGPISPAVDSHGLGGLLFALVTGMPPYAAANPTAALHRAARGDIAWPPDFRKLPRDLRAIIETCLEREPARRYASAALLAEDLQRFLDGLPVQARPASPLRRLAKTVRRRPAFSAAIAFAAALAMVSVGGLAYHTTTLESARARVERSEQRATQTTEVASRSMGRLTGDLIERLVRRSRPDDAGHVEFLRQVRDEFANWPLGDDPIEGLRFRVDGLQRVASLFAEVSHFDEALACLGLASAALDEIAMQPGQEAWSISKRLTSLHIERYFLYNLRRLAEATASARQSLALLETAPTDLPDRDRELVRAMLDLGMFLHEERQFDEGGLMIEEAVARMTALRQSRPDEISLVEQEAHVLFTAQLCAWNAERFDDCRRWSEQLAREIGSFLAPPRVAALSAPQRDFLTKMVCMGLTRLSQLAEMAGRIDEAIDWTERRRQLSLELFADLPASAIDPRQAERLHADLRLAELLERSGRSTEAEEILSQAAAIAVRLHDAEPAVWEHASLLALICQSGAKLAEARGDHAAAATGFAKVITLMEPWLANPTYRATAAEMIATAPVP